MDFFARQERSRRASRRLVLVFLAAFATVAAVTTAALAVALHLYTENHASFVGTGDFLQWIAAHGTLLGGIGAGTFGLMSVASLTRAASLARGGGAVARMLGATEVAGEDADPLRRRLLNVVEEMAIASGVPVPDVFVLEKEAGINAFAAGLTPNDAAIAVTRGALEQLSRAELQGVIAHEFSHIVNGDMRLNQRLMALAFGILVLSLAGRFLLRSLRHMRFSRGRKGGGGVLAVLGLGVTLTIIGSIGMFFSRIIKAAVSRERERLADASAVQFTREPTGLAGALKKIGAASGELTSTETEEVAHMLFARGAWSFRGLFATHPPLTERIRALEPGFSGEYPAIAPAGTTAGTPEHGIAALVGNGTADARTAGPSERAAIDAANPLARAGVIETPEVGEALRNALPDEIYHAAHSRDASALLVLALALSPDANVRTRQLALLEQQLGAARASRSRRLDDELAGLDARLHLPLLELTAPALRRRPRAEIEHLFELLERLAALEPAPRLLLFAVTRMLAAFLGHTHGGGAQPAPTTGAAVTALLSAVAAFGHDDAPGARAAYRAGLAAVDAARGATEPGFDPPAAARDLGALDAALARLATLKPTAKRTVLAAVLATIRHDRQVTLAETELFRAIAAILDCPVPPYADIGLPES